MLFNPSIPSHLSKTPLRFCLSQYALLQPLPTQHNQNLSASPHRPTSQKKPFPFRLLHRPPFSLLFSAFSIPLLSSLLLAALSVVYVHFFTHPVHSEETLVFSLSDAALRISVQFCPLYVSYSHSSLPYHSSPWLVNIS